MLTLKTNWEHERAGDTHHYLMKAIIGRRVVGRAHGSFCPQANFVIEKIELDPAHRSRGHGSAMIAALRAHARTQQCARVVFRSVRRDNHGAVRLYTALQAVEGEGSATACEFVLTPP